MRSVSVLCRVVCLVSFAGFQGTAFGTNDDGAEDLGVDYAFLFLMTLSPDFAAANYTIENEDGTDVDIAIGRFPFHVDLTQTAQSRLGFEGSLAFQRTEEFLNTFPGDNEYIDAYWNTVGISAGLLYEKNITKNFKFVPSFRFAVARMENSADYSGTLTLQLRDILEGTVLNWNTNASILSLGIGATYNWELLDRASRVKADIFHIIVDSFDESNSAVEFTEHANMFALDGDMVFPTDIFFYDHRLDLVLLAGINYFFGENRRTLGYTTSYQLGAGAEFPLQWKQSRYGHLRLSGQFLWAENMRGWMLTVGYNPD